MKEEFIKKWSNWWIFQPNAGELTEAFEKELNAVIAEKTKELQDKLVEKDAEIAEFKAGIDKVLFNRHSPNNRKTN